MKNIIRIAAASLTLGLCAGAAHAGSSGSSLAREAHRLVDHSDDLRTEVVRHLRHTREYRHLLGDAAKIRCEAKSICRLANSVRSSRDVYRLRAEVEDLKDLVCHVGGLLDRVEREHRSCRVTRAGVKRVRHVVACMNSSLNRMEAIVDSMERRFRYHERSRPRETCPSERRSYSSRSVGERIAGEVLREILRHR